MSFGPASETRDVTYDETASSTAPGTCDGVDHTGSDPSAFDIIAEILLSGAVPALPDNTGAGAPAASVAGASVAADLVGCDAILSSADDVRPALDNADTSTPEACGPSSTTLSNHASHSSPSNGWPKRSDAAS